MANDNTGIEWCDATWNPTTGCDRVSAGCDHRYALELAGRLKLMGQKRYQHDGNPKTSGPGFALTLHPDKLDQPLRWTKPRRIFVNSMSDLFHAKVPDDFILKVFAVMANSRQHTYQVLTKRPQRMQRFVSRLRWRFGTRGGGPWRMYELGDRMLTVIPVLDGVGDPEPPPNVWLGTSVENQEAAYRIDWLVKTPAAVRFLSCEPLIGPVDLDKWIWRETGYRWGEYGYLPEVGPAGDLHWVITGGESGPNHRPFDPQWAIDIKNQCAAADIAYFHKQHGGRTPKAKGRLLEGREWGQFPEAVRAGQAAMALEG